MSTTDQSISRGHIPSESIDPPPLYAWPPKPIKALQWLFYKMWIPHSLVYFLMAVVTWNYFTPSMETMRVLSIDWIALVLIRNWILLFLIAGSLHWWLYMRKGQAKHYKYELKDQVKNDVRFLWRDQVKDNMFWSLVSGVPIWTTYEVITYWIYASGKLPVMTVADNPLYFVFSLYLVIFWSTAHFYFNHRFLHWKPMYKLAHELHHRNVNIAPWAGISMHPVEHVIYFSIFILYWFIPVHPVVIVFAAFFQGLSPSVSHSGFEKLNVFGRFKLSMGDYFHQLHHKYFHVNYGNIPTPFDYLYGSWHDGTKAGREIVKQRMRRFGKQG